MRRLRASIRIPDWLKSTPSKTFEYEGQLYHFKNLFAPAEGRHLLVEYPEGVDYEITLNKLQDLSYKLADAQVWLYVRPLDVSVVPRFFHYVRIRKSTIDSAIRRKVMASPDVVSLREKFMGVTRVCPLNGNSGIDEIKKRSYNNDLDFNK